MALPAADAAQSMGARILELLGPRPGRLEYAIRIASICALTTLVTQIYQTPDLALTAYVVFYLNKPDRVESLLLNVVQLAVITVVIGFALLVATAVIDAPLWRTAAMAAISFGCLFLAAASKLRPLGAIIAMIIAYTLDLLGTIHGGEIATRALLYAWLFVGIPAGASFVINLLFAPPPRKLAERAIAERLRLAAAMLRGPDERTRAAFTERLREGAVEIQTWLKLAALEKTSPPHDIASLGQAAKSTAAILSWVDVTDRVEDARLDAALRDRVARTLEAMAAILLDGAYPVDIELESPPAQALMPAPAAKVWNRLREGIVRFAQPSPVEPQAVGPQAPPAKQSAGFLEPDAFTNPDHVRYALKTTAAAMLCYVLYSLLDWPGIHTCFITCYLVSLYTTAETVEKLTLRILGCLIGAASGLAAIVFLLPSLTSIEALLCVVFVGALASAWVAGGGPRISYVGLQIAFAFFLCILQGPAPAFELEIARDRIIGVLVGNLVVYLIFTRVWPVSVSKRVDDAINALLRRLSAVAWAPDSAARVPIAVEAQAALGALEADLELIPYEPASIRPDDEWLQARRRAAAEIAALAAPLLLIPDEDPNLSAGVARRFDRLAARSDATRSADGSCDTHRRPAIRRTPAEMIREHLIRLEQALYDRSTDAGVASHAAI